LQELARLIWEDNIDAENSLGELRKCMGGSRFSEELKVLAESISNLILKLQKILYRELLRK